MSSSRKPLIRNSSHSDRPTAMRNWPLFVFLLCLVLTFYIFYVYQAQGAALTQATEEARLLSTKISLTNTKLVESLADLETCNASKNRLTTDLDDVTKKSEECMTSLRSSKLRLDGLEKDTKTNADNYTKMQEELSTLKLKSEELQRNNTALTSLVATQEQLINQLNQTIGIIKFEKEELRNAANYQPAKTVNEKPAERVVAEIPENKNQKRKKTSDKNDDY
uniref:Uncharacterized protein n=1 Tax=Caenorhabditis japonica TaxID=281687 RepID=A0A8R1DWM4_CAEJA